MKQSQLFCIAMLLFWILKIDPGYSQVTTAAMNGKITDRTGEGLPGANVIATHTPTGTQYGASTRVDGGFNLPNLRVGGPYTIAVSFIGFKTQEISGVQLNLGQNLSMDFSLEEESTQLGEVIVTAEDEVINSDRTGASTNITNQQLTQLPTISRSAADIYRLSPASDGNSFGGRNDQFNNFSLDGSIFNNPFGLDAATPGGQTDAQPISLDAIDQIQVSLAPYDVTQAGFTGAAINAVTKSGTNEFHGTVFGFYRNDGLTGSKVSGSDIFVPDLTQFQAGFSLGGPIIKNKLFFFANFELERREDLGSNFIADGPNSSGENVSRVLASDLQLVSDALSNAYGYETGPFEGYKHDTDNQKGIVKLDWNINQSHTLTATYNFLDATKQKPAHPNAINRRGPDRTTLQFFNSGYEINNIIHSGILELRSNFGNKYSNKLQIGFTKFDDSRDPFSTPFPVINILENGIPYIISGHEPFSINNRLEQNVIQFTDNFDIYSRDHIITLGTSFEKFSFDNSFNLFGYGSPFVFHPSVDEFVNNVVGSQGFDDQVIAAQAAFDAANWALAETNVGQWAIYAQDRWAINQNFTLTYGLRIDLPLYFDTEDNIPANTDDITYFDENANPIQLDNTKLPDQNPLFSPRIGFNWDIKGDQSSQLRGGSGVFSGRLPFVWIGNQVANPFTGFLNVTEPDFKFPQVWRTNVGYDHTLENGLTYSLDVIYSKDINGMIVRNFALGNPGGTLMGVDNRPVYRFGTDVVDAGGFPGLAYVFTNTDEGRQINISFEMKKRWEHGLYTSLGYNYLNSKDQSSIEAEISSDAFDRNPVFGNSNNPELSPSLYGNRHRILGTLNKRFQYGKNMATTVSIFFEYVEGNRFSYTYSGDINGDTSPLNDLLYIPTDGEIDQMNFDETSLTAAAQRSALKAFIAQDDYLSENRGGYAEKYAILSPWYSHWDLRVLQDFKVNVGERESTVQVSLDILNVGNLISSDWGVRQFPVNTQPIGVSVSNGNDPTYSFDPSLTNTFTDDFSLLSRWQAQVGLRYIF